MKKNKDALSRNPVIAVGDVQVYSVSTGSTISELLASDPLPIDDVDHFAREQLKDTDVTMMTRNLELPEDATIAWKVVAQAFSFSLLDGILYFVDPRRDDRKLAVVLSELGEEYGGKS